MKFLGLLLAPLLLGCLAAGPSYDEVARSSSPDQRIDAIVIESNGGATTSFRYDVCLAASGGRCTASDSIAQLYGASRSDQAYGVNVRWVNPALLHIEYLDAQRVVVKKPVGQVDGHTVNVVLQSGIADTAAPPGGMLYNVQGRPQDAL